jgi:glutaredoxin/alkylhydroperoxidase family enzyme
MTEAPTVQMFTKPDCVFCEAAKRVLTGAGIGYQELDTASAARLADSAVYFSGRPTVPQVFAGGRLIDAPGDLERLAAAGRLPDVVGSAASELPLDSVPAAELARGAEDVKLADHLPKLDGTHDPDPEAWALLHFYRRLFGFWPNTMAYLYRWPTAYKLFVYCQNLATVPMARKIVGTPMVSLIGYGSSKAHGCSYCTTHAITLFEGLDVDVKALEAAREGDTDPANPFGPFEVAVVELAARIARNAVTDEAVEAVRAAAPQARFGEPDPDPAGAVRAVTQMASTMGFFNVFNDLVGLATEGDMARTAASKGIDSGRHAVEDKNPDNLSHELPEGGPTIPEMVARYESAVGDLAAYTTEHLGLTPGWMEAWPEAARKLHAYMYVTLMGGGGDAVIDAELKHLMARVSAVARDHAYLAAVEGFIAAHVAEDRDRAVERVRHAYQAAIGQPESMALFDAREQSALRLAWLSAQIPLVTPRRFVEPLVTHYDDRELIELIVACSIASMTQRFVTVARPDIEPAVRTFLTDHAIEADPLDIRYPITR